MSTDVAITIADDEVDPLSPAPANTNVTVGWKTTSVKRSAGMSEGARDGVLPLYHGLDPPDQSSTEGKFSWVQVSNKGYLPEITRYDTNAKPTRYISVKMAEKGFLSQYMKNLPPEVLTNVSSIYSHKATDAEAKLLFEINTRHCDSSFGKNESFVKDLLVKSDDFVEFYNFLTLCNEKMVLKKSSEQDKCGFLRIANTSDVPYVVINKIKHMPLFYFEGELGSMARKDIKSWDWAYLKFCCKIQGVKSDILPEDSCPVVGLTQLKSFFPSDTTYTEYWPSKDYINRVQSRNSTQSGSWTKTVLNFGDKFQGKLTPLRDFPVQPTGDQPYKAERALIDKKRVNAVNTKPYQFSELLVTLPSLVETLFPRFSEDQIGELLLEQGLILYSGNTGHRDVLRCQGWEDMYTMTPLVTVKDVINNYQTIKNCLKLDSTGGKRLRGF